MFKVVFKIYRNMNLVSGIMTFPTMRVGLRKNVEPLINLQKRRQCLPTVIRFDSWKYKNQDRKEWRWLSRKAEDDIASRGRWFRGRYRPLKWGQGEAPRKLSFFPLLKPKETTIPKWIFPYQLFCWLPLLKDAWNDGSDFCNTIWLLKWCDNVMMLLLFSVLVLIDLRS